MAERTEKILGHKRGYCGLRHLLVSAAVSHAAGLRVLSTLHPVLTPKCCCLLDITLGSGGATDRTYVHT